MTATGQRSDKRRDLLDGALAVFARDGYSRAGIDAIAAAAGVSTRTIYNRFGDKAGLFRAVIVDSAERVAEAQVAVLQRQLGKIVDIEADLIEFGRIWNTIRPEFADHFALVRQINAEVGHVPAAALNAWQQAGPLRVRKELARHLQNIADQGHLRFEDSDLAAAHLIALVSGDITNRTFHGARPLPKKEMLRISDAGVRAFLNGYGR
ncbi:MAG TPA: TetR/AcrR family transcriptional regulator [Mycobacteriales bacterium]|nr:TetR/AcrR family transcriptional regulator [Mycobacteriales bacterium]